MRPNLAFGPIDSFTQYLLYLSVVAIGILVPLAIQRWVRWRNEKALVVRTVAALNAEVKSNQDRVRRTLDSQAPTQALISEQIRFYEEALDRVRAGGTPEHDRPPEANAGLTTALTDRTAWDTAMLSQALPLLPPPLLASYSRVYRTQEAYDDHRSVLVQAAMQSNWLDAPFDVTSAPALERRIETLLLLRSALRFMDGMSQTLLDAYAKVVPPDPSA